MTGDCSGQLVDFYQSDASGSIFAGDNSSGVAQRADADYGRLSGIRRSQTAVLNFRCLGALLPIVVRSNGVAIRIKQAEHWIHQNSRDTELYQSRSKRAHDYPIFGHPGNKTADNNIAIGPNHPARTDVG